MKKNNRVTIKYVLFFLLIAFTLMPNILNISIGVLKLKPLYFIMIIFAGLLLRKNKILLPYHPIVYIIVFSVVVSLVCSIEFGLERTFFNYIIGLFLISVFKAFGKNIDNTHWILILRGVWITLFTVIIINNLLQIEYFKFYLNNLSWLDHPYHNTVVAGGANLEATWVAILAVSFLESKYKWIPVGMSTALALFYGSRAAILCIACVVFIFINFNPISNKKTKVMNIISTILIVFIVLMLGFQLGYFDRMLSRFNNIGNEAGSEGRLKIWSHIMDVIFSYPFGVGLGNAITAMSKVTGLQFGENNLHFLLAQMFVDIGVIGGFFYTALWLKFICVEVKNKFNSVFAIILGLYFIISFIQFSGGESFFFCILGIYLNKRGK